MCPEALCEALEWVALPWIWDGDGRRGGVLDGVLKPAPGSRCVLASGRAFGVDPDLAQGMRSASYDALPTLALGFRLESDPVVAGWVEDLHRMGVDDRHERIAELTQGAPRGIGRVVITELLTRAAEGGTERFLSAGATAAFVEPSPKDGRRAPKRTKSGRWGHDKRLGLAKAADRVVAGLVAHDAGLKPAKSLEPDRRAVQRLLQEVAAHVLRSESRPVSPSIARRAGLGT